MTQKSTPNQPRGTYETLTARIIADMKPGEQRGDKGCPGLRVRCTEGGVKVFDYRYAALDGSLRQVKLGEFGPLTLSAARAEAITKRSERDRGIDPKEEKRKRREAAKREREARRRDQYFVKDLVRDYADEVLSKQKRGTEGERVLNELVRKLGDRPARELTRRELQDEIFRPALKRAPRLATYMLSRTR